MNNQEENHNEKINKLLQNYPEIKILVKQILDSIKRKKKYKNDSIEMLQDLKKQLIKIVDNNNQDSNNK